jgi:hypothetical protein
MRESLAASRLFYGAADIPVSPDTPPEFGFCRLVQIFKEVCMAHLFTGD